MSPIMNVDTTVSSRFLTASLLAIFLLSGVWLWKPLDLALANPLEFSSSPRELAPVYLANMAPALLAVFLVSFLALSNRTIKPFYVALVFALGSLFYFQSNFLAWDYGVLDGRIDYLKIVGD